MEFVNIDIGSRYDNFLRDIGNKLNWNTGLHRFHADDYCIAQTYCLLYLKHRDASMIQRFRQLADSLVANPHTESLEWKNNIVDREWAWCDALFMVPPALCYLSVATGNPQYRNLVIRLWWKTTNYLYDATEHLYFRDQNFFSRKEKNGQKIFWSRGNGWVIAGLARVLETIPQHDSERKKLLGLFR